MSSVQNDIRNFVSELDVDIIDKITISLLEASTVYLIGIGSDAVAITFLNNYLGLMDIDSRCITSGGLPLKESLYRLSDKDVVLMSSYPQILRDNKWVSEFCKSRGATFISLNDSTITSNFLNSDYSVSAKESIETFFNSCILPLLFSNVLLLKLYEKAPIRIGTSLKKYSEILKDEKSLF